jgi:hypothetical protein
MNLRAAIPRLTYASLLLAAGLVLWGLASWPLPRVFSQAIPHTNLNPTPQVVHPITPGDHLQLLYHFWLGLDVIEGHSPPFHNVYEFNLGDDSTRLQPDLYYMPFSLVYAALAPWTGHAAGWNAAGLASVLVGVLGLGLLARRFTDSWLAAGLATLLAAAFPYRWISLFVGSPTGFGMAFPPLLFYGLDRAIRDRSIWGGVLAGLAIFGAYTSDLHTFYFSVLAAPAFAALSLWMAQPSPRRWPAAIRASILPLLPFVLLVVASVAISSWMSRHLSESVMAGGRTLEEMASYSPPAIGLVSTVRAGMANHAYFGIPLFALLGVLLAFWAASAARARRQAPLPWAERLAVVALVAAVAVVVLLALGIHGPFEGVPIRLIRKVVPKYTMIRQTVKIYSLLPALLAPLLAVLMGHLFRSRRAPALRRGLIGLVAGLSLWTLAQSLAQTTPGFCRLPRENAAYAAVADDEKANAGKPAHALAIPLWPGDSHWTSLYEYAVMVSRVRLVNGYAPAVPADYFLEVFKKYESLNQGVATDEQLDALLKLGVRHLLFHSDAFPDKVSPFPAAATLRALTGHPRLSLIAEDGLTFAFRILPKHPVKHVPHANWTASLHTAMRHWHWDPPLRIAQGDSAPLLLRAPVFPAPNLRLLLRLAEGSAQPLFTPPGREGVARLTHPIPGHPDWLEAELASPTGGVLSAIAGPVAIEHALLAAGDLPAPGPDGSIRIAPALLHHVGHSSPGLDPVWFDPETVPAGNSLGGPNLPFPPGVYDITLSYAFRTDATESPGFFQVRTLPARTLLAEGHLDPAAGSLVLPAVTLGADPIRLEFHYHANLPVALREIRLTPATVRLRPATP